jgi:hypothetical protein
MASIQNQYELFKKRTLVDKAESNIKKANDIQYFIFYMDF